jgi:hypothetical protein
MKATDFEYRHQTLLHLLVVGLGVSTYFLSRDDIVWALVRHHSNSRFLEQAAFGVGTLMLLGCAVLETWASAYPQPVILLLSRPLFALVLGLLVPLPGTIVSWAGRRFWFSGCLCAAKTSLRHMHGRHGERPFGGQLQSGD